MKISICYNILPTSSNLGGYACITVSYDHPHRCLVLSTLLALPSLHPSMKHVFTHVHWLVSTFLHVYMYVHVCVKGKGETCLKGEACYKYTYYGHISVSAKSCFCLSYDVTQNDAYITPPLSVLEVMIMLNFVLAPFFFLRI